MQESTSSFDEGYRIADFPGLAGLRLNDSDLPELSNQGFVTAEKRGPRTYHKLRFRRGSEQKVRYIGGAERAAAIKKELEVLQREVAKQRKLKELVKAASRMLRDAKAELEPLLASRGYAFHGLSIRRPRNKSS
jgi:hypothetical protein